MISKLCPLLGCKRFPRPSVSHDHPFPTPTVGNPICSRAGSRGEITGSRQTLQRSTRDPRFVRFLGHTFPEISRLSYICDHPCRTFFLSLDTLYLVGLLADRILHHCNFLRLVGACRHPRVVGRRTWHGCFRRCVNV